MPTKSMVLLLALVFAAAAVAKGHVVPGPDTFTDASYGLTGLRVGHGCDELATTEVILKVPELLLSVRPRQMFGWNITTTKKPLTIPAVMHGSNITETVDTITWSGELPLEFFQVFEIQFYVRPVADIAAMLTEDEEPANNGVRMIFLPVIQKCGDVEVEWTEIWGKGAEEPEHPAPILYVEEAQSDASTTGR